MFNFSGKLILVVGASSGIGKQTAVSLSAQGARVILIARREDKLKEVLDRLSGEGHAYYCADVADFDSVADVIDRIVREHGKLDGMVYAAGVDMYMPLRLMSYEKILPVFQTNYFGFIECTRQVCKRGRYNSGFRIVSISSVASLLGESACAVYSATKAAMDASIRCLAKELASKEICINSVAPAMIQTQMYDDFIEQNGEDSNANRRTLDRQYLGLGQPVDVVSAIAFLLSDEARFITGVTLPVDGGFTSSC